MSEVELKHPGFDDPLALQFWKIRHQLQINIDLVKRGHPDEEPALLPHMIEILTDHVFDRLNELEQLVTPPRPDAGDSQTTGDFRLGSLPTPNEAKVINTTAYDKAVDRLSRAFDAPSTPQGKLDTPPAGSREAAMVVIERDDEGKPTIWCDPEIVDLVTALNAGGVKTIASCSGHGMRPGIISLDDGRELIIAADYAEAREVGSHFPGINGEPPSTVPQGELEPIPRYRYTDGVDHGLGPHHEGEWVLYINHQATVDQLVGERDEALQLCDTLRQHAEAQLSTIRSETRTECEEACIEEGVRRGIHGHGASYGFCATAIRQLGDGHG